MFCELTRQTLNRAPGEIERHVGGRRYTNAKKRYDQLVADQQKRLEKSRLKFNKKDKIPEEEIATDGEDESMGDQDEIQNDSEDDVEIA